MSHHHKGGGSSKPRRGGRGGGEDHDDSLSPPPPYYDDYTTQRYGSGSSSRHHDSSSASPARGRGEVRSGGGGREVGGDDGYDFEVSLDKPKKEKSKSSHHHGSGDEKKKKPGVAGLAVEALKKSREERMAEILARARSGGATPTKGASGDEGGGRGKAGEEEGEGEEESAFRDFAKSIQQLRASLATEGVGSSGGASPGGSKGGSRIGEMASESETSMTPAPGGRDKGGGRMADEDQESSSTTNSSDISEGDFQPGAYAAKVWKRKMEMKQKVLEKQQQEAASPSSPMVQAGSPVSPSKPAHEEEEQDMGRRGGEEEAHDLGSQTPPMRRYPAAVPPPPDNEEPTSPVLPMRPADAQLGLEDTGLVRYGSLEHSVDSYESLSHHLKSFHDEAHEDEPDHRAESTLLEVSAQLSESGVGSSMYGPGPEEEEQRQEMIRIQPTVTTSHDQAPALTSPPPPPSIINTTATSNDQSPVRVSHIILTEASSPPLRTSMDQSRSPLPSTRHEPTSTPTMTTSPPKASVTLNRSPPSSPPAKSEPSVPSRVEQPPSPQARYHESPPPAKKAAPQSPSSPPPPQPTTLWGEPMSSPSPPAHRGVPPPSPPPPQETSPAPPSSHRDPTSSMPPPPAEKEQGLPAWEVVANSLRLLKGERGGGGGGESSSFWPPMDQAVRDVGPATFATAEQESGPRLYFMSGADGKWQGLGDRNRFRLIDNEDEAGEEDRKASQDGGTPNYLRPSASSARRQSTSSSTAANRRRGGASAGAKRSVKRANSKNVQGDGGLKKKAADEPTKKHGSGGQANDLSGLMEEDFADARALMEREARVFEREMEVQDRALRVQAWEAMVEKKQECLMRSSLEVEDMRKSFSQVMHDEEEKSLQKELGQAREEASLLKGALDALRSQRSYLSHIDEALVPPKPPSNPLEAMRLEEAKKAALKAGEPDPEGQVEVSIKRCDLEALRREMSSQERLLDGYQKENEKLVKAMAETRQQHSAEKKELLRLQENLNKEVNALRNKLQLQGSLEESQLQHLQSDLRSAAQLRALEEEIHKERQLWNSRELEMRHEIDKLRKAKLEAEMRAEGTTMEAAAEAEQELSRLQTLLEEERAARKEEVKALKDKIKWYAENQELVDRHTSTISRQTSEIRELKSELEDVKKRTKPVKQEVLERRIKELENQLSEMEASMRRRNPDCLVNLIRAANTTNEMGEGDREQSNRLAMLEEELSKQKEDHEVKLRSLRQEHERLKLGYEDRIKDLTAQLDKTSASAAKPSSRRGSKAGSVEEKDGSRAAELEKELERVRQFYTKKIKDVEKKADAQVRAVRRGSSGYMSSRGGGADKDKKEEESAVNKIKEYEEEMEKLKAQAQKAEEESTNARQKHEDYEKRIQTLEGALALATEQIKAASTTQAKLVEATPAPPAVTRDDSGMVAALEREVSILKEEVASLRFESGRKEGELMASRGEIEQLKSYVATMSQKAHLQEQAPSSGPSSLPMSVAYHSMLAHLHDIERRTTRREKELAQILATSKQQAQLEVLMLKASFEQELQEKDMQILMFRRELDSLLAQLEGLKQMETKTSNQTKPIVI